jgi:glycerol-3-phosphate acyltransferase PlsY
MAPRPARLGRHRKSGFVCDPLRQALRGNAMIEMLWPALALWGAAFAFGYGLGAIPFGLLITRVAGAPDVRTIGSGNIGATNVLRTGHRGLAAATLVGDALKGTVAVLVASRIAASLPSPAAGSADEAAMAAALGAFLGHLFPVWLGFKGGKGVATFIGLLIGFAWPAALGFCAVWLAVAAMTRYSSLSALIASAGAPVLVWYFGLPREAMLFAFLAALLWIRHRANITRLLAGTEGKIGAGDREFNARG